MRSIKQPQLSLDELVPMYAVNKMELDNYKKICDTENAQIKEALQAADKLEHSAGGYTAKMSIQTSESFVEDMLLQCLESAMFEEGSAEEIGIIKTKRYVDMQALEDYMYHHKLSQALIDELDMCKVSSTIVKLRVSKTKAKKDGD